MAEDVHQHTSFIILFFVALFIGGLAFIANYTPAFSGLASVTGNAITSTGNLNPYYMFVALLFLGLYSVFVVRLVKFLK